MNKLFYFLLLTFFISSTFFLISVDISNKDKEEHLDKNLESFEQWTKENGKNYTSYEEFELRFMIFKKNVDFINNFNKNN